MLVENYLSRTVTGAGRCRWIRGRAVEPVLALALGGAGCGGFGVVGANLAELGGLRRLEVTRFASCERMKKGEGILFFQEEKVAAVKRHKGRKE